MIHFIAFIANLSRIYSYAIIKSFFIFFGRLISFTMYWDDSLCALLFRFVYVFLMSILTGLFSNRLLTLSIDCNLQRSNNIIYHTLVWTTNFNDALMWKSSIDGTNNGRKSDADVLSLIFMWILYSFGAASPFNSITM